MEENIGTKSIDNSPSKSSDIIEKRTEIVVDNFLHDTPSSSVGNSASNFSSVYKDKNVTFPENENNDKNTQINLKLNFEEVETKTTEHSSDLIKSDLDTNEAVDLKKAQIDPIKLPRIKLDQENSTKSNQVPNNQNINAIKNPKTQKVESIKIANSNVNDIVIQDNYTQNKINIINMDENQINEIISSIQLTNSKNINFNPNLDTDNITINDDSKDERLDSSKMITEDLDKIIIQTEEKIQDNKQLEDESDVIKLKEDKKEEKVESMTEDTTFTIEEINNIHIKFEEVSKSQLEPKDLKEELPIFQLNKLLNSMTNTTYITIESLNCKSMKFTEVEKTNNELPITVFQSMVKKIKFNDLQIINYVSDFLNKIEKSIYLMNREDIIKYREELEDDFEKLKLIYELISKRKIRQKELKEFITIILKIAIETNEKLRQLPSHTNILVEELKKLNLENSGLEQTIENIADQTIKIESSNEFIKNKTEEIATESSLIDVNTKKINDSIKQIEKLKSDKFHQFIEIFNDSTIEVELKLSKLARKREQIEFLTKDNREIFEYVDKTFLNISPNKEQAESRVGGSGSKLMRPIAEKFKSLLDQSCQMRNSFSVIEPLSMNEMKRKIKSAEILISTTKKEISQYEELIKTIEKKSYLKREYDRIKPFTNQSVFLIIKTLMQVTIFLMMSYLILDKFMN